MCDDSCVAVGSPVLLESVREHKRRGNGRETTRRQVIVEAMVPREVGCRSIRRTNTGRRRHTCRHTIIRSGAWMSQKILQKMATLSKFILKIADTNHRVHRYLYTLKICCKFGLKTTLFFCPARTTTLRLSLLGLREAAHSVSSSYRSSGVLPGLTSFCTASKAPISRRGRCESPAPASVFPCLLPRLLLWNVKIQDARHRASPKVTACKLKISSRDKRQPFCVYASSDSGQFLM